MRAYNFGFNMGRILGWKVGFVFGLAPGALRQSFALWLWRWCVMGGWCR